jgi:anti-anti-sigma factor
MVIETFLYEFVITPELRLPERQKVRCASRSSRVHRALRHALAGRLVAEMSCHCCGIVTPAPQATRSAYCLRHTGESGPDRHPIDSRAAYCTKVRRSLIIPPALAVNYLCMDLQIESGPGSRDGVLVIRLRGPFTLPGIFEFQALVRTADAPVTIIDLTDVPFMDSAALGAIMYLHASRVRREDEYALVGVNDRLRTMFQVGGVDHILVTYPTVADAETALIGKAASS